MPAATSQLDSMHDRPDRLFMAADQHQRAPNSVGVTRGGANYIAAIHDQHIDRHRDKGCNVIRSTLLQKVGYSSEYYIPARDFASSEAGRGAENNWMLT